MAGIKQADRKVTGVAANFKSGEKCKKVELIVRLVRLCLAREVSEKILASCSLMLQDLCRCNNEARGLLYWLILDYLAVACIIVVSLNFDVLYCIPLGNISTLICFEGKPKPLIAVLIFNGQRLVWDFHDFSIFDFKSSLDVAKMNWVLNFWANCVFWNFGRYHLSNSSVD